MRGAVVNTTIVTMDGERRILKSAGLIWGEDGRIQKIGKEADIQNAAKEQGITPVDADGAILFPGMIDTHNHLFQHLLKGVGTDMSLESWWPSTIGVAGKKLTAQQVRSAVAGGVLEALRTGTTTIVDYMQVHPVPHLSEVEIETAKELGIRFVYARGYRDYRQQNAFTPSAMTEDIQDVINEITDLDKNYTDRVSGMTRVFSAPASIPAVSLEGLADLAQLAREKDIPVTMHTFETGTDEAVCRERYGKGMGQCLEETGILDASLLAVHCVRMSDDDIALYRDHGVRISHNPLSNMYLASGVAPVPRFLKEGMTVSLGCDGAASNNSNNMLEVLKTTALLHKVSAMDPQAMTADEVLAMATIGGAKAIGMDSEIGSIEEGKRADFFLFDPRRSATCSPVFDPVATLVYSADSRGITAAAVNGTFLLKDDAFTQADEEAVIRREQEQADELFRTCGFTGAQAP